MLKTIPFFKQLLIVIFSVLALSQLAIAGTLTTKANRVFITEGETFNLSISFDEQVSSGGPDLYGIEESFHILQSSRNLQLTTINGQSAALTEWLLTLIPKKTGQLTIPSLSFQGAKSAPLTITVNPDKEYNTSNSDPFFVESEINIDSPYVQQQIIYTRRLLTSINIYEYNFANIEMDNAIIKPLDQVQFQREIDGKKHIVIEETFAIYPQDSGEIIIPSQQAIVKTVDRFRRAKIKHLQLEEQRLNVKPQAENHTADTWLPAQDMTLTQNWSDASRLFTVGEPVTRTLTLKAKGLTAAQLPEMRLTAVDGIKMYPEQPQTSESIENDGMSATRTETVAYMPTKAGTITLPPVEIKWWDTGKNQESRVVLPEQTLTILPSPSQEEAETAPAENTAAAEQAPASDTAIEAAPTWELILWRSTTVLFALLSAVLFFYKRATPVAAPTDNEAHHLVAANEKDAYKHLKESCNTTAGKAIRYNLIQWAQSYWPQEAINSLTDIQQKVENPQHKALLQALDSSLYSAHEDNTINGASILEIVQSIKAQSTKTQKADPLPPLYKQA